jgi:hypothetical protein
MDGKRFDQWTRLIVGGWQESRRSLLRLALSALLSEAAIFAMPQETRARCVKIRFRVFPAGRSIGTEKLRRCRKNSNCKKKDKCCRANGVCCHKDEVCCKRGNVVGCCPKDSECCPESSDASCACCGDDGFGTLTKCCEGGCCARSDVCCPLPQTCCPAGTHCPTDCPEGVEPCPWAQGCCCPTTKHCCPSGSVKGCCPIGTLCCEGGGCNEEEHPGSPAIGCCCPADTHCCLTGSGCCPDS